uniref:hypothetical protein n=1 Tax=Trichocoleus desertorum TaxID=1481672 RepID=UPI0025B5D030|nr:hypothetical protein [Trichocoleus desertorum]
MPNESFEPEILEQIGNAYDQAESKLQDAIELLQQLESLKQQLEAKDHDTQVLEQELVHVYQSKSLQQEVLEQIGDAYDQTESKLEDTIELLQEQLKSLKQQLEAKDHDTQVLEQELVHVYQALASLNQKNQQLSASPQLPLSQAKILAQVLLERKKLTPETLAGLLSAIYSTQVKPKEFYQAVGPTSPNADC